MYWQMYMSVVPMKWEPMRFTRELILDICLNLATLLWGTLSITHFFKTATNPHFFC